MPNVSNFYGSQSFPFVNSNPYSMEYCLNPEYNMAMSSQMMDPQLMMMQMMGIDTMMMPGMMVKKFNSFYFFYFFLKSNSYTYR